MPKRNKNNEIEFKDFPEFTPNLSPREIFAAGSFGGTYWRPIHSNITGKNYKNVHKNFPASWWKGIPENYLTNSWDEYDKSINKYGVKVGTTLEFWEKSGWITKYDSYGWIEWYCNFYSGRRCKDDDRQIKRWLNIAGPNGRFKKQLISMIKKKKAKYNDYTISPKIRQTLQHWAVTVTSKDCK
jgi:hypothetical protein